MSIKELKEKIKGLWGRVVENEKDLYIVLMVIIIALGAFGLGRLSAIPNQDTPVTFSMVNLDGVSAVGAITVSTERDGDLKGVTGENGEKVLEPLAKPPTATQSVTTAGRVVASKNGTKYHLPDCSGAKRIKEENKVWFESVEAAKAAGYSAAANCPGI